MARPSDSRPERRWLSAASEDDGSDTRWPPTPRPLRTHRGVARLLARLQEASAVRGIRAMGKHDTTETGRIRRVGAA